MSLKKWFNERYNTKKNKNENNEKEPIDIEKAQKLLFGTYIRTEQGVFIIVGREYIKLYLYPVGKGIDTTTQPQLEVYPKGLDSIEIIKEPSENERNLLYTKLMMSSPAGKENIGMFKPLELMDLENIALVKYWMAISDLMEKAGV